MDVLSSSLSSIALSGPNGNSRLENYLRLNRASKKILYRDVPRTLGNQEQGNYSALGSNTKGASALYSGYSTLFQREVRARFVHGVANGLRAEASSELDQSISLIA